MKPKSDPEAAETVQTMDSPAVVQERLVQRLRIALADSIRRPMGVVPDSAEGLITQEELDEAEKRRMQTTEPQRLRLRAKAEAMRKRMEEKGIPPLPYEIQQQTIRDFQR